MGAMGDLGVHKSDLIRYLLNDEVAQVAAFVGTLHKEGTDVDDNSTCLLRMKAALQVPWLQAGLTTKAKTTPRFSGAKTVLSKSTQIRTIKLSLSFVTARLNVTKWVKLRRMRSKRSAA